VQVVHGDDASLRVATLEEHGEVATDKACAAGDQNVFGKGGHGLTGQTALMNFFEHGAMDMTTAARVVNLAGKAFDTFRPGQSRRAYNHDCFHEFYTAVSGFK
jgi:hypothetical protein